MGNQKMRNARVAAMMRMTMGMLLLACVAQGATVTPKATDEALVNPDMGFVFYHMAGRMWAYGAPVPSGDTLDWFPGTSTVYFRLLWSELEPEEGQFRWDMIDRVAQNWIAKGKKEERTAGALAEASDKSEFLF